MCLTTTKSIVICLQEGGSITDQAKESAEALKEKTKEIAGQAAKGLKNAAGSSPLKFSCPFSTCVVLLQFGCSPRGQLELRKHHATALHSTVSTACAMHPSCMKGWRTGVDDDLGRLQSTSSSHAVLSLCEGTSRASTAGSTLL